MPSRSLLLILLAAATLFATASTIRFARYGGAASLTGFGCIPGQVCFARLNRATVPAGSVVFKTGGYDGQFFHYIAAAIYSKHEARVDAPPLRWSRIGFPLLAGWGYLFGPRGLVVSMLLVLLGLHLWAIVELHRFLRFALARGDDGDSDPGARFNSGLRPAVLIFALNPFSLLAFQLQAADGAALSLGLIGILYYLRAFETRFEAGGGGLIITFLCLSLSYLSKETMLAVPVGFGGAAVLRLILAAGDRRAELKRVLFWAATGLPLLTWWLVIDFTPGRAASHGGAPFLGLWRYLQAPDALYSPRGFLLLLLPLFFGLACVLVFRGLKDLRRAAPTFTPDVGGMMLATIALISLATNHEYWMNFANIGRMFTAGVIAWALIPALLSPSRPRRYAMNTMLVILAWFSFLLLQREATGKLLPYFIW